MLTQEFILGVITTVGGSVILYLQQQDWYCDRMFKGFYKQYNTPSGRIIANIQVGAVVLVGVALCLGMIQFDK